MKNNIIHEDVLTKSPFLDVSPRNYDVVLKREYVYRFFKRTLDIIGSIFGIILLIPITLIIYILTKIKKEKGSLFYTQQRIGKNGKIFKMYKFRSMIPNADEALEKYLKENEEARKEYKINKKLKNDPRVTKVGDFIRKTSIDELPQLINVLKGDMSLIGPRPERPQFVEKFREEIPRYMVKHQVRPGLTGWAQVNGYRGDTSIKKRIEYDLYYNNKV